ncbi:MAG TPA: aquaporin, partial [bacterium]|nr:aquaporin [bacterium]
CLLAFILPGGREFGATIPSVDPVQALLWETVLTFFLMFVITAMATDTRATGTMAGAAIGATVMFCSFVGGPVTGASMNPARSFAPALFQHQMSVLWIYGTAPFLGAIAGVLAYEAIRRETSKNTNTKSCC